MYCCTLLLLLGFSSFLSRCCYCKHIDDLRSLCLSRLTSLTLRFVRFLSLFPNVVYLSLSASSIGIYKCRPFESSVCPWWWNSLRICTFFFFSFLLYTWWTKRTGSLVARQRRTPSTINHLSSTYFFFFFVAIFLSFFFGTESYSSRFSFDVG